jgi:single stranded DNA-binding protein
MSGYAMCIIQGNIGKAPKVSKFGEDRTRASFSVAVSTGKKGLNEKTSWLSIVSWDKQAELVEKYFTQGQSVLLETTPQTREYTTENNEKRTVVEFRLNHIIFLPRGQKAEEYKENLPF